jgi:hypothetical protein
MTAVLQPIHQTDALPAAVTVAETTDSTIRTFFYQLSERNTAYRSLHSLTQQIEHQYHGRFLIELIQNAHDALGPLMTTARNSSRIEICLKPGDKPEDYGTLYVANDGEPFSLSNFNSLSQLGQSDKDPQKSIGNKGIGFRSVLEITDAPSIFSRSALGSAHFDGFCFGFAPTVLEDIAECAVAIMDGRQDVTSPVSGKPFIDWADKQLSKFRSANVKSAEYEGMPVSAWLRREMRYVSPYLLPIPILADRFDSTVRAFEARGFASLIRFPLKSAAAAMLVREKIEGMDAGALLFLDRVAMMVLDSGERRREIHRYESPFPTPASNGREVCIAGNDATSRYLVWSRHVLLTNAPSDVQASVRSLPGKWPEIREAAVSIAVQIAENPRAGILSIFLPTQLQTGCSAHINAPFFGDMSRTHIDFGDGEEQNANGGGIYNRYLLEQAAELAFLTIEHELEGRGLDEARAIADLLAPFGEPGPCDRWQDVTDHAAKRHGFDLADKAWHLSDQGWTALNMTSLLPQVANASVLTPEVLRRHATFAVFVQGLSTRAKLIENLSRHFDTGAAPKPEDLASTIEAVAIWLLKSQDADWNGFWRDVDVLFKGDFSILTGKRVLLGSDGQLHAGGMADAAVFFVPRQGLSDDEEVDNDGDIKEIPESLRKYVAFLNEKIHVYEERFGRLSETRIRRRLLDSRLVARFRREDILRDVLVARTPKLPLPLSGPHLPLCSDILLWGLRLMENSLGGSQVDRTQRLLRTLPVPCSGGWYPLGEAAFGPGWQGTHGESVERYVAGANTPATSDAAERLLTAPTAREWGGNGSRFLLLLRHMGVFDGLRLHPVTGKEWSARFPVPTGGFRLPLEPPPGYASRDWNVFRALAQREAKPLYGSGKYEFEQLYTLPGFNSYRDFDVETRQAFMDVVFASAGQWDRGWETLRINRVEGNSDCIMIPSPLLVMLSTVQWIALEKRGVIDWARPVERWYVPVAQMQGGRRSQFAHLNPLPSDLADRLDRDPRLAAVLARLGTPKFDLEVRHGNTVLLEALSQAVLHNNISNRDVFLGQVRAAWRSFDPKAGSYGTQYLLVQIGSADLSAQIPRPENRLYLPNSTKSFHGALRHFNLPVIAIEPEDAKRLSEWFNTAYPGTIIPVSDLDPVPLVDGTPWSEIAEERLQEDPRLGWLVPVLLTIAAFHGPHSHGANTDSFRRSMEVLREARVVFARTVETSLNYGDSAVARPIPVAALWLAQERTLLVAKQWKDNIAGLSEALADMLGRDDLDLAFKLFLREARPDGEPGAITRGLESLKLSDEHYRAVREHWRGDARKLVELLVPLLTVLDHSNQAATLVDLATPEAIAAFLDDLGDPKLDHGIIDMARGSRSMFDFGLKAFHRFGPQVQLSRWNAALAQRGQPEIANGETSSAFAAHIASCGQLLRSLLVRLVARQSGIGRFQALWQQLEDTACPSNFSVEYWEVDCNLALAALVSHFSVWQATDAELEAIGNAVNPGDLSRRLAGAGVDIQFEPFDAARDNRERLRASLQRLEKAGLAWALAVRQPDPARWEGRAGFCFELLQPDIADNAYLRYWTDAQIWQLIQTLANTEPEEVGFWEIISVAAGLEDLALRLGLTADMLDNAAVRLEELRDAARRRKRLVHVCGSEFDGSEDNLTGLWRHITTNLPHDFIPALPQLDLKKTAPLADIQRRPPVKLNTKSGKRKGSSPKYLSKSMETLIGLAGEIHAFRMLQATFGGGAVSATSWISTNSLLVFEDNRADDGAGYDIAVIQGDRTYYMEVKSSEGMQTEFTLEPSEIRLARELARKSRKRRKETFQVLRVLNALSTNPRFELLPNPYDPRHETHFDIVDSGARVTYRTRK